MSSLMIEAFGLKIKNTDYRNGIIPNDLSQYNYLTVLFVSRGQLPLIAVPWGNGGRVEKWGE